MWELTNDCVSFICCSCAGTENNDRTSQNSDGRIRLYGGTVQCDGIVTVIIIIRMYFILFWQLFSLLCIPTLREKTKGVTCPQLDLQGCGCMVYITTYTPSRIAFSLLGYQSERLELATARDWPSSQGCRWCYDTASISRDTSGIQERASEEREREREGETEREERERERERERKGERGRERKTVEREKGRWNRQSILYHKMPSKHPNPFIPLCIRHRNIPPSITAYQESLSHLIAPTTFVFANIVAIVRHCAHSQLQWGFAL